MTKVCVSYNAVLTNCLIEPVIQAAQDVFTLDGANAAALNQGGTINSAAHPAAAGTAVSIFATGLGPITPPAKDGAVLVPPLPANISDVNAEIVVSSFSVSYRRRQSLWLMRDQPRTRSPESAKSTFRYQGQ
jgi:uncharacterized protein (TIGR03437 family)